MAIEEFQSPENSKRRPKRPIFDENGESGDTIISPRFRSVAAMAGWDEESLLLATLVVEDTPERESNKKRLNSQMKTSPMSSRRKRRVQRTSPASNPIVVLNLDDDDNIDKSTTEAKEGTEKPKELQPKAVEERKIEDEGESTSIVEIDKEKKTKELEASSSSSPFPVPCMDRLREELSCAICLEICYKPSSTSCGHSFCKKCLRSAADKCGKRCPKCRQLISNGRSCTVNTVLWNTIQLLFPQEVEARKAAEAVNNREGASQTPTTNGYTSRMQSTRSSAVTSSSEANVRSNREYAHQSTQRTSYNGRTRSGRGSVLMTREISMRSSRGTPVQAEDAALALRLQREEFMEAFRGDDERDVSRAATSSSLEDRRARALRAISLRRGRAI